MNALVIRDAREADLNIILDIYNEAILITTAVYDELANTIDMRLSWFSDKLREGFRVLVAVIDNDVVGFGSFGHFRNWACYRYTVELSVYVHNGQRGRA